MKNKKEYYGLYINDKIPKISDKKVKYNRYFKKVKFRFLGKTYIIDSKNNKKEIKSNEEFNKNGKYLIEFINAAGKKYNINIEIKKTHILGLLIGLFLCIVLFVGTYNLPFIKKNIIQESTDLDINLEGIKYVFDIDYNNTKFKEIKLTDTVKENAKIYPGSEGYFYIQISTKNGNKDIKYKMEVDSESSKPQNLRFELDNKTYNSMNDLAKNVNGTILKNQNKTIKIKWFWDYNSNYDNQDTLDGTNKKEYSFLMRMIGIEEI